MTNLHEWSYLGHINGSPTTKAGRPSLTHFYLPTLTSMPLTKQTSL